MALRQSHGYLNDCQIYRLVLAILSVLSAQVIAEDWKHHGYIQQSFERIALSSEYAEHPPQLRKWRQPIIYQFQHDVADSDLHEQLSNTHLQQLSSITGHPIQMATAAEQANLQIIFTDEAHLAGYLRTDLQLNQNMVRKLSRNSVCVANFSVDNRGEIIQAQVVIPVDRARAHGKLLACIVEELTQIMGLPNDDVAVFPSVFNDRSHDNFLSGLDYILLKLLYQPDLTPGMNVSQSRSAIKKIMRGAAFQRWLQQADIEVRASGLYPLLE